MPLRWRLIGLYALILAAVLVCFSVALAHRLRESLVEALDRELEMRTRAVAAELEFEPSRWFVEADSELLADYQNADADRYFLVADAGGVVMLRSPLAESTGVGFAAACGNREVTLRDARFRETCLVAVPAADAGTAAPATVQVACGASLARVDAAVAAFTTQLWTVGPPLLVLSLIGGWLLVSRALRPIHRIAATAERISGTNLKGRIDVRGNDELARLGRTLNAAFARLQAAFERERRLLADASHELRTPLAVIAGNVELATSRERSAAELRLLFAEVGAASERMRAVVEGMLALARADAGVVPLQRQRVSLAEIADAALRLHRPLASSHGVELSSAASDPGLVSGDPARLADLVSNLVTNAIRYNRPGGTAAIQVRRDPAGSLVELSVTDTGIGIEARDLSRIFDRFFRADPARSRAGEEGHEAVGTGLGLAIAKWIAEAHGGSIAVTSELGSGSQFVVRLPAAECVREASPSPACPKAGTTSSR
ncbi:MAG TPA: ATP-binding protein [Planctomycetota bacterium]|nr:ATP-binding protein [Planctomycetota bacterium]